jgi:hypothetical protein
MSQNDLSIANQGFASFRSDLNSALQALGSTNSGTSAPSTTYANQLFYDTTNNILKIRNEDNDAFISLFTLDQTNDNIESLTVNGVITADSLDISGDIDVDGTTNLDVVDIDGAVDMASTLTVNGGDGITIQTSSDTFLQLKTTGTTANNFIEFKDSGGSSGNITYNHASNFLSTKVNGSERMRIDNSGNVGIGTTSPATLLHVENSGGNGSMQLISSTSGTSFINMGDTSDADAGQLSYINNDNAMAFTVNASEAMRIDSNGNVGIGDTSPESNTNFTALTVTSTSGTGGGQVYVQSSSVNSVFGADNTSDPKSILQTVTNHPLVLGTNNTERMRINDDGSLFINHASNTHPIVGTERLGVVGGTGSTAVGIACNAGHATGVGLFVSSTPDGAVDFVKFSSGSGGDTRGLIEFDGSNMTYGGTSDYRLKENIATYTKGIETLKKLNPIAFTWKESKASDVGFLAHEVAEIHPSAVSGDKDGMETVAGEEKIRPQMLDPSKLVGILTGALQEAVAKIETLEAEVKTLKGG